jgi:hypothetical protein
MFTDVQLPVRQDWGWGRGEACIPPAALTPLTLPDTSLYICTVHELCSRTVGEYRLREPREYTHRHTVLGSQESTHTQAYQGAKGVHTQTYSTVLGSQESTYIYKADQGIKGVHTQTYCTGQPREYIYIGKSKGPSSTHTQARQYRY